MDLNGVPGKFELDLSFNPIGRYQTIILKILAEIFMIKIARIQSN